MLEKRETMDSKYKNNSVTYEEFFKNGQVKFKTQYNKKVGFTSYEYYENGQLKQKSINKKDGKKDGIGEYYDENGKLIKKETYKDGVLIKTE
jgi:antitoxin component YwqK of YwqJK toxin-antitoxin module